MVKGKVSFESDATDGDFIIQKRDDMPTYNFAVVIDDHLIEITHVLRGDDHVANTSKQLIVYEVLGWRLPKFGHMTLIISSETSRKLSKRDESVLQFIEQYRDLGYLPEAIFNFVTLPGWSPVDENEIFSQGELIESFDPKRLSKSPTAFNQKKLGWISNQYVKKVDRDVLLDLALSSLQKAGLVGKEISPEKMEWVRQLISIYTVQVSYTKQIVDITKIFFEETPELSDAEIEEIEKNDTHPVIEEFKKQLDAIPHLTTVQVMNVIRVTRHETGVRGRELFIPTRIAATRPIVGPGVGEAIELTGEEKVNKHIDLALEQLGGLSP